jgi:hypothetical protein
MQRIEKDAYEVLNNAFILCAFVRPTVNRITHVLQYARRIFSKIETKDPVNKEAADL